MLKITLSFLLICATLPAQSVSAGAPPSHAELDISKDTVYVTPGLTMAGAAAGEIGVMSHPLSFPGMLVKGAPYSAEQVTEHIQTLADGNRIVNTSTSKIYRDSQGRTRTETSLPPLAGGPPPPVMTTIHDPVAGVTYMLNGENKTAQKVSIRPLSVQLQKGGDLPPLSPSLSVTTAAGPVQLLSRRSDPASRPDTQTLDLGNQTLEGVLVAGTRITSTIPAGAVGNEQPIETVSERWFSQALHVVVKSSYSDPRIGQTTESLQNLTRTEPDPALFQVPADFTLTELPGPNVTTFVVKKPQ